MIWYLFPSQNLCNTSSMNDSSTFAMSSTGGYICWAFQNPGSAFSSHLEKETAPPVLTVAFVKILGLKTHWIWFLDTQNTFYLMVKGLKNAYLMHFPSLHSWFRCSVCFYLKCSSSHNQRVIQRVKKHFFCQNLFQIMYNQKQKSNVHLRKKTQNSWP